MKRALAALALVAALSACVTPQAGGPPPPATAAVPRGAPHLGGGPVELGDWRRASTQAVIDRFSRSVAQRYPAGLTLAQTQADLRASDFACAPAPVSRRGDPPDMICRRAVTVSGCTHTWQVHLFDDGAQGRLARTRALYDRRCAADDGLLGGPG